MAHPSQAHHQDSLEDVPTRGRLVPWSRFYDLHTWILTLGREQRMRERTVELARVAPGDRVLEVGCGTGSLAIAAKAAAGPTGKVYGIDPSKQMMAAARRKTARKKVDVTFEPGVGEKLRFGEGEFDLVLCSLVLHHLPPDVKVATLAEIRRVLRPGGRFFVLDFGPGGHGFVGHRFARHGHGHDDSPEISQLLASAGFVEVESGAAGFRELVFWRASTPAA